VIWFILSVLGIAASLAPHLFDKETLAKIEPVPAAWLIAGGALLVALLMRSTQRRNSGSGGSATVPRTIAIRYSRK